jgi:hypothetical protein
VCLKECVSGCVPSTPHQNNTSLKHSYIIAGYKLNFKTILFDVNEENTQFFDDVSIMCGCNNIYEVFAE